LQSFYHSESDRRTNPNPLPARYWTVVTQAVPTSPTVNTFVRALDSDRYQLIEKKDNKEVYRDKQTGEKWIVEVHRRKD